MSYYPLSTQSKIVKALQYNEEVTYGTLKTASPVYLSPGPVTTFNDTLTLEGVDFRNLGSRSIYRFIETKRAYAVAMTYAPFNATMIRYGTEEEGGTGTIEKSLSFLVSQKKNNAGTLTEFYQYYLGMKTDSIDVEVAGGLVMVNQRWIGSQITIPSTTSGLTTPTYASPVTATPWSHKDGTNNPLTVGGNNYDCMRFRFGVANNLDPVAPNGWDVLKWLELGNKEITFDFEIIDKDNVLLTDAENGTPRTILYTLGGTSVVTLSGGTFKSITKGNDAANNQARRLTFSGSAEAITVSV